MKFTDVLEHAMANSTYWYNDPKLAKKAYSDDLMGPYNLVSDFCQKYGVDSPGIFKLADTAEVVRELKFLKMRKVITVEKMVSLYNMTVSADDESKKLAEKMINVLMERTK